MPDLKLMAKCCFAILVIVSLAVLVERLTAAKYSRDSDTSDVQNIVMSSTLFPTTDAIDSGLNEKFSECLTEHLKFHYLLVTDEKWLVKLDEANSTAMQMTSSSCFLPPEICMHYFLIDFQKIMESLGVQLQLIEPSVLFCLLPPARRYNLLTRGFSHNKFRGSRNIMTFGVSEADAKVLDKTSTRKKLISIGFRMLRYPKSAEFRQKNHNENSTFEALQYFFKRHNLEIHVIVFYQRETYLWHPGLNADFNSSDLLFLDDGAYDNFSVSPFNLDVSSTVQIYLPSDPRCFLLFMESSKFLECKNMPSDTNSLSTHDEQLKNQAFTALKELKKVLGSQMVTFWLWSRTLLGWFEKCDILHYSTELELSVAVKSILGYNFTGLFTGSECHTVKQDFNLSIDPNVELNCKGMTVKISFMYEENNIVWYSSHDEQSSYRQMFPIFEICSVDILGLKANVPCDTAKIFETEFGQNWKNMSLSFNPKDMINLSTLTE